MEVKVYNNVFDNKYDTFTYDPTRKLIEQLEEHVNTDVYKETLVECYDSETGETFYAPISEDTCDSIAIFVNDKEVDINYQPSENDVVSVVFLPASKAAQGTAWGVLMGVVVALGVGLITIATGGTWTWLAEAFIIISGGVLGWAIGDQMDQKEKTTTGQKTGEQLPDVRGAENSSIKGNNFPFVLGKHLVTPFRIGDPTTTYTGTRGENAYIRELLCVGYAPLKLTDFKLGDFMLAYNRDHTGSDGSTITHDTLLKGLLKGYSVSPNPADSGDIVDYWKNNEIELEILQQTDKENSVDYGTIYNEAVDDQQVKGDMFYICDKQLDETAQVTYKGASFPNMFRTNGVYLTNACPRQFTVNFNFPNGLYETYSNPVTKKKTETVYESIPLWCCLQWRIYNSNNPTSQADGSDYDSWNTFDFGSSINKTFTTALAEKDKSEHLGNDFGSHTIQDVYGNFLGKELQNFEALGGEDGISQMRVSATVTLTKEQCKQVIADTNKPKIIEIRCLRVSPNYINETSGNDKGQGASSYSDHISCTSVVTLSFDEEKLRQNDEIVPIRPLSEADMKKFCIVAIKAKADTSGYVQSQLKSINCIAESFSPVWDSENKKILPEGVEAKKKYYGYFDQNDERVDRSSEPDVTEEEVTKAEYEAARQDGINWLEEDCGSNYADIIKDIIFDTSYLHNGVTAWALSASSKKYNNNSCVSAFLLSCVGPQNGSSAIGYDRINTLSISDWADKSSALIDGSRFSADTEYNGVQYQKGDLIPLRMESNAYIYQGVKIEDLLSKVAFCGRAVWCIDDAGKIRVIMDAPADYTKGIISSQNCVTPNNIYSFEKAPAGLYISFSDENDGYETNQVYCWSDGNTMENYHGKVEGYNIEYVTNPYQIWSLGRYLLACREQQREVLTRKIGPEGNLFTLGDVILVQTDSLMLDNSAGRVQEILKENGVIYGFICDTPFEYLGVVDSDGNSTQGVTLLQTSYTGKSNTVTLPISAPRTAVINNKEYVLQKGTTSLILFGSLDGENYGVVEGNSDPSGGSTIKYKLKQEDICVFGIRDKITAPYRITKIKPEKGGGFTETLVPYDESLYNYGKSVPSFQTFSKPSPTIAPSITLSETPSTLRDLNFSQSSIISQVDSVNSDVQDISEKVDEIDAKASVWSSTATCTESTTSIAISSLSISSVDALRVDDSVIASGLMFHISAINETTVTVDFLFSCKGADGADGQDGADGSNGTNIWYSSAPAQTSTTSIALNTITGVTGHTVGEGDLIVANGLVFFVSAISSSSATVVYKETVKGGNGSRAIRYLGKFATAPTTDILSGDWYLDTTTAYVYYYNANTWTAITTISDYRILSAVQDMIELYPDLTGSEAGYTVLKSVVENYVECLATGTLLANEIFSNSITVGEDIRSGNWSSDGTEGFKLSSDGTADINELTINKMKLAYDENDNLILGEGALENDATHGSNPPKTCIAIGKNALYRGQGGYHIGIGNGALEYYTGYKNIGIGYNALNSAGGGNNIAIGSNTLGNCSGVKNVAIGTDIFENTDTGGENICIGSQSMKREISSSNNISIGSSNYGSTNSPATAITGSNNVAIGYGQFGKITTGSGNISITNEGGTQLTTGNDNIIMGNQAGYDITTGSNNVCIGNDAGSGTQVSNNGVFIGKATGSNSNNQMNINNCVKHLYGELYVNTAVSGSDTNITTPTWKKVALEEDIPTNNGAKSIFVSSSYVSISGATATINISSLISDAGITVGTGTKLDIMFLSALESASTISTVTLKAGKNGTIQKIKKDGTYANIQSTQFTAGYYNSSKPYKVWEAGTLLEVGWNGSVWLCLNNATSFIEDSDALYITALGK